MSEEEKVMGRVRLTVVMKAESSAPEFIWRGYSLTKMDMSGFRRVVGFIDTCDRGLNLWSEDTLACMVIPVEILKKSVVTITFHPSQHSKVEEGLPEDEQEPEKADQPQGTNITAVIEPTLRERIKEFIDDVKIWLEWW